MGVTMEERTVESKNQTWSDIGPNEMLGNIDILRFGRYHYVWSHQKEASVEILL